jgi:cobalt-zinc-cadmium efflux system outer membrane protein
MSKPESETLRPLVRGAGAAGARPGERTWPRAIGALSVGLLACLATGGVSAADGPRALSLEEALRLAATAPAAQAVALEVQRAEADIAGAGLWPNPEVSFSREAAGEIEQVTALSQTLPWSGRLSLEKSAARRTASGASLRARQARVELGARVRQAFFALLAAQDRTSVLDEGWERLDDLVRVLAEREKAGESSGYDHMRAERERADVEADRLAARGARAAACATLAGLLAIPSPNLRAAGVLAEVAPLPPLATALDRAAARGDVAALSAEAEAADLRARAASRRALPDLDLEAGVKTNETGGVTEHGGVIGLSLSVPLFDHGQAARAVARVEGTLVRTRREALLREASAEVEGAWQEARARQDAEAAYGRAPEPEELVTVARAAYDEGETRILDLLDAYRAALAAGLRTVDLHLEARRAEAILDRSTGVDPLP